MNLSFIYTQFKNIRVRNWFPSFTRFTKKILYLPKQLSFTLLKKLSISSTVNRKCMSEKILLEFNVSCPLKSCCRNSTLILSVISCLVVSGERTTQVLLVPFINSVGGFYFMNGWMINEVCYFWKFMRGRWLKTVPAVRFWWIVITTLYHFMLQSWYWSYLWSPLPFHIFANGTSYAWSSKHINMLAWVCGLV